MDQPATIGALPAAVAQGAGILVGYLPGMAMRRIVDLNPGEAKTNARDAYMIAEAARTMPHTLRSSAVADKQAAELSMLCGFDDDLAKQATAASNRIRGLLTQIQPSLLLHAGGDTTVIALWLGHGQIVTTNIYLHADMTVKEAAIAKFTPPGIAATGRYQPTDTVLAFLAAL